MIFLRAYQVIKKIILAFNIKLNYNRPTPKEIIKHENSRRIFKKLFQMSVVQ